MSDQPQSKAPDLTQQNDWAVVAADEWLADHRVSESWRLINRLRDQLVRTTEALNKN